MKNYSSKQANKGKTAYRTPSRYLFQKYLQVSQRKSGLGIRRGRTKSS